MLHLVFGDAATAPPDVLGPAFATWRDDAGDVFARAGGQRDAYWLAWRGLGTFTFAAGSARVTAWPSAESPHAWIADQFSRLVQPVILQALGREALHASAVLTADGVIALCGLTGSGKSTLAFALGREPGCRQIADDALVLEVKDGAVTTRALPFNPRLRDPAREFFGIASSNVRSSHPAEPDTPPLLAVFVLHQRHNSDVPPALAPVAGPAAFTTLLTHAHCFDERDRGAVVRMVNAYLTIADRVPIFSLVYRPHFAALSELTTTVLRAVAPPVARP
jgi:hypothetical protein